jgi:hypothetical protein
VPELTFSGNTDDVAAAIVLAFGLSEAEAHVPLGELIPIAARKARALWLLVDRLDATPIAPAARPRPAAPTQTAPAAAPSPAPVQQQGSEDPPQLGGLNPLYKAIADASSVEAVKLLYGQHQAEFDSDAELMDAWRSRGRYLQGQTTNH